MSTEFTLVATGFGRGVAEAAARDLSKNTGVTITLAESGSGPNTLYAESVSVMSEECSAGSGISGRPGCAYIDADGDARADVAAWVAAIYGPETEQAALTHELYHLLASRFQPISQHSTNAKSLMYEAWNPRRPPSLAAADRRALRNYYE